jgi:hypothetical protein
MPKAPVERGFSPAIEYFREEDGRWLADIPALLGVTAYGRTRKQATAAVQALALRLSKTGNRSKTAESPIALTCSECSSELSSEDYEMHADRGCHRRALCAPCEDGTHIWV